MIKLNPALLALEIDRFQSIIGTGSLSIVASLPSQYRFTFAPIDLPEDYMLYLLGYRSFDSEFFAAIPALADPSFLFAKSPNCNHLIEPSEYANIAGASTIIYDPLNGSIHAAAINVSYDHGTVSAYRGECAGLFLGKALLYYCVKNFLNYLLYIILTKGCYFSNLEIDRFQSIIGTGSLSTVAPFPSQYRFAFAPIDYRSFDSEFLAALPALADPSYCNHLIIVSDGSECANIAGAASTIIYDPLNGSIHAAAINVSYGHGKVSAYRGECAGLFLGKALLYLLRKELSQLSVVHYIDNKGVISPINSTSMIVGHIFLGIFGMKLHILIPFAYNISTNTMSVGSKHIPKHAT
eukprot:CAMPEP_0197322910 /NCGR_PEP_ID=MMETSP0891-20130614/70194_1 /TAXON_ID=44058 ORGANISM="Aureoumbra lagunensis, Strain CCMP1510" /NCGR_SAMPLE_ID=MMETSP0891 /ASSEMBLY_ACC=CAM_ASM_000534 /LENGTH=351 /DNA_ID=CAMNT_0042815429 /DNA_START=949 /DNA_END=2002 /DNA_ORIENTATION=+